MWKNGVYLEKNRRRPVRFAPYKAREDLQAAIPAGWCNLCGKEVYGYEKMVCSECERWGWGAKPNAK